jgi:hypothetical protein
LRWILGALLSKVVDEAWLVLQRESNVFSRRRQTGEAGLSFQDFFACFAALREYIYSARWDVTFGRMTPLQD